jgi:SAM-dependent methyltransferase
VPDQAKRFGVICPCCDQTCAAFRPAGLKHRPNAQCPECGARERHRMVALYLKHRTTIDRDHVSLLDIAPHPSLQRIFSTLSNIEYLSADLQSPLAMVKTDICAMPFADASFDVVICMHVLEHVPNDRQGIREVYRVLKPGGWAILQVPIDYHQCTTFEDPTIESPQERERLFGQHDHVRLYGLDYRDRLEEAGFQVELVPYPPELGPDVAAHYGLKTNRDRYTWVCTKAATTP